MTIHAPGRIERKARRRSINVPLNLTSMIDVLVVTLVFLLFTFSSSNECGCLDRHVAVPSASGVDMIDAPMVTVTPTIISIDGIDGTLDDVFTNLRKKREVWKSLHPSAEFPGVVVLRIDQDVKSGVVKQVTHQAAKAGYPSLSFMVERT